MQRRVTISAEVTMSVEKGDLTMSAEKGDHECREGDHECRER